jgi:hypothetical protein
MKPHYPVHPLAFHFSLPLHFKAKVKKKRFRGRKIIDDYTHMIYSMDLHISYSRCSCASRQAARRSPTPGVTGESPC